MIMNNWNISENIKHMVNYRDLLFMLTWRDIAIKYKQSVMGFMWAMLMPMLIVLAGLLVRYAFSKLSGQPVTIEDIAAVSVKAIPWAFFVASIRFSTNSLISNANLVTKIYFPRELFPISAVLSQLFDLIVASVILAIVLSLARIGISLQLLWVPLLLILLTTLALGIGILLSACALFFRDVKYIIEVILTFGIFFTPVFYDVRIFGEWAPLLLLNPLTPILEGFNACIVHHEAPALAWLLYSAIFSIGSLLMSFILFKNLEPAFAECI